MRKPTKIRISWASRNRTAKIAPNPKFPDGIRLDPGQRPACRVELPYPAPCIGLHYVECQDCFANAAITAAGRPDDPRSVMLPCKRKPQ